MLEFPLLFGGKSQLSPLHFAVLQFSCCPIFVSGYELRSMQRWFFGYTCQGCASPALKNRVFQRKPSTIFSFGPYPLCPSQPLFLSIIKFKPLKQNSYGTVWENLHWQRQQNQKSRFVRVSIPREHLDEIIKDHLVEHEGKEYFIFEVAALTEADQYGKTHSAYISKKVNNL